ncbi:MAG TPA: cation-translocating P-type ATPase C-terminal domain-containing protein, partial [Gemmatimonadaceae bacterium]|nr:cation-translocating P-type ATPase C-terminal domain-containing protein [Gemmatimonadaceae bacterium]
VLIQFFKAFSFRSDRNPVWQGLFANRWLLAAIAWELLLLAAIIHWPALHRAFGTTGLSGDEWWVVALAAATILPVLELTKALIRRRYPLAT